jgi:hypothetical protein
VSTPKSRAEQVRQAAASDPSAHAPLSATQSCASGPVSPPRAPKKFGAKPTPDGGLDATQAVIYRDPATAHKSADLWREPLIVGDTALPLRGSGPADPIPIVCPHERGQRVERRPGGKTYIVRKDADGFPEFTIFETYIGDEHIGSGEDMGLSDQQIAFLKKSPAARKSPPGLIWHHHQDVARMQLVDRALHERFGHAAGMQIWGGGR